MKHQLPFATPSLHFLSFLFLLFTHHFPLFSSTDPYTTCGNTFNCGGITSIDYPFWGGDRPEQCGHPKLQLNCNNNFATITILNVDYNVLHINQLDQILTVKRSDLGIEDICPAEFISTNIDTSVFEYVSGYVNLTIQYGCPPLYIPFPPHPACIINGVVYSNNYIVPGAQGSGLCRKSIVIPVLSSYFGAIGELTNLGKLIEGGFEARWKVDSTECNECENSGGRCGFDLKWKQFTCFCPESDQLTEGSYKTCSPRAKPLTSTSGPTSPSNNSIKIILPIVGAVIAGVAFAWLIFYCRQRRKKHAADFNHMSSIDKKESPTIPLTNTDLNTPSSIASTTIDSTTSTSSTSYYPSSMSEVGRSGSYFGAKIFTYNELEEATGNFDQTKELGDGGFGAVYYGTLSDGSVVAVKRLYENNYKRVEQFMNEVKILSQLRHKHLVTLYGCTSKQSRELLLVYEYIPNGTIADHLQGKRANSGLLSWPIRLNIAIETADALAYLHASDIIHRDVKSNNILLDNDFHVKVADFGLSRLFPNNVTHVSTAPQGTPGYVDPEYHQIYQLTEKSDVYSFGVVLMELVTSLPAVDINRHRHDINLANMAVNKIQNHTLHEMVDPSLTFETNSTVKRMITLVAELAFRCLQQEKEMRPSMQEVLDGLREIQNGSWNAKKEEVLDILVDDGKLLRDDSSPPSPNTVTYKWISGSTKSSSR